MTVVQSLKTYKWPLLLVIVAAFLFYWYEVRPVRVYRTCQIQSAADARTLLGSKAEISKGTSKFATYNNLIQKNMYLRSDYESFLQKCLMFHGMEMKDIEESDEGMSDEDIAQ